MAGASIWVDADACPNVIKEILFRAAERTGVSVTLVANQSVQVPRIPSLRTLQVSSGFDVADAEIVKRLVAGDLVVTADIPLAAEVIAKGGEALNPRGERYSPDTIRGVLAMRDFLDTMRSSGNVGGGRRRSRRRIATHSRDSSIPGLHGGRAADVREAAQRHRAQRARLRRFGKAATTPRPTPSPRTQSRCRRRLHRG